MTLRQASRREVLKGLGAGAAGLGLSACGMFRRDRPVNIVFILADDLGYGDKRNFIMDGAIHFFVLIKTGAV